MSSKNKYLILLLFLIGISGLSMAQSAASYFVFKPGKTYLFQALGKNKLGIRTTMIYQCKTLKDNEDGQLMYFENKSAHGVKKLETYYVENGTVFRTYSKNDFGGEKKNDKQPILKVPVDKSTSEWSIAEKIKYKSGFQSSVQTSGKTYSDVLVVTENTWHNEMLYRYEKRYYVKDIGLVKIEVYDGSGLRLDYESFEVI